MQVRQWWNGCSDRRAAAAVERYTVSSVAPALWAEEAAAIAKSGSNSGDNMTIRVRPSVREVVAVYTVDDGSMEQVSRASMLLLFSKRH